MTNTADPVDSAPLTPELLAMEIYDFCKKSMAEVDASIKTMEFLTAALGFAISASTGADDQLRIKTQRTIADMIAEMPRHPATWTPGPEAAS